MLNSNQFWILGVSTLIVYQNEIIIPAYLLIS